MARACKFTGGVLAVLGIMLALGFVFSILHDENYARAALVRERNPGNVMYEAEFKGALVVRAFQAVGLIVGVLLVIHGTTLVGLGMLAERVARQKLSRRPLPPELQAPGP